MTVSLQDNIKKRLIEQFHPESLTVTDDSHRHRGHPGAQSGGHFSIHIISHAFTNKTLIERHRMIYSALSEWMNTGIHALQIHATTPDEKKDVARRRW